MDQDRASDKTSLWLSGILPAENCSAFAKKLGATC